MEISSNYTEIKLKKMLTGNPERSEYFFAGLNAGGASILPSKNDTITS